MLTLSKYSIGVGDRFGHQARAQLKACQMALEYGVEVVPVWNKSNREHTIIGSEPIQVRLAADNAVRSTGWRRPYHVDADHIRLETVDRFVLPSDFFTVDVADFIGRPASEETINGLVGRHPELVGTIQIPGIEIPFQTTVSEVRETAGKYLYAIQEAGRIYRHIRQAKGRQPFITEISMDETDRPQTPPELLVILAAIADEQIPVQTLAPKFTGRFNKGVDYVGDVARFEKEFNEDLCVIAEAVKRYGLPANLKLSVHSGSDKFSIYAPIRSAIRKHGAGLHLKTAGTTWLEELIGLAESGGTALETAKLIYGEALAHLQELCAPYATVIDIRRDLLPAVETVKAWSGAEFVAALRHDPQCRSFNPHLRQLLHVGFKIAAKMGPQYLAMLKSNETTVARNVTHNLFDRHIKPVFV